MSIIILVVSLFLAQLFLTCFRTTYCLLDITNWIPYRNFKIRTLKKMDWLSLHSNLLLLLLVPDQWTAITIYTDVQVRSLVQASAHPIPCMQVPAILSSLCPPSTAMFSLPGALCLCGSLCLKCTVFPPLTICFLHILQVSGRSHFFQGPFLILHTSLIGSFQVLHSFLYYFMIALSILYSK